MSLHLLKSSALVGAMTLVSRVLGFLRDMVIARYFGAGLATDAFFVAFKIPNFLRRLFAEGSFANAFVPVLSEYKSQREQAEVRELVSQVSGTLGVVLFVITAIGILAAPVVIAVFAPGFIRTGDKYDLAVYMLRLTFPYLLFISLTALASGILNSYGRFAIPALTPVLLNLAMIAATIWVSPHMEQPIVALAWGVFFAGVLQLGFQLPFLRRLGLLPRPRLNWRHEGVRRIGRLILPGIFGSSVAQINLLIDTVLASFLVTGSVSWLYYSDRLMEFPLGVFGIALATVILPSLSRRHAEASHESFSRTLDWGLRWVLLVATPATVGLFVLAGPILSALFQYEEFTVHDVLMARRSLMAYALGLPAFILIKVLATGYYSRQDTRTPVRIGIIAMVTNLGLNLALILPLAHAGLALATSAAAFLNAGLLFRGLVRAGVYRPEPQWTGLLVRVGAAALAMATALTLTVPGLEEWVTWPATVRLVGLLAAVMIGAGTYFGVLWVVGMRWSMLVSRG